MIMKHCGEHLSDGIGNVDDGIKRFHGDGLIIRMGSNHRTLEITGDGCKIILSENSGSVHVVGDGCKVRVSNNMGNIKYTGDGGRVFLGPDSSKEKVKFVGDGGKIIFDPVRESSPLKHASNRYIKNWNGRYDRTNNVRKSLKNQRNVTSNHMQKSASSCNKVIRKKSKPNECKEYYGNNRTLLSNQEDLDNMINDIRETRNMRRT